METRAILELMRDELEEQMEGIRQRLDAIEGALDALTELEQYERINKPQDPLPGDTGAPNPYAWRCFVKDNSQEAE